VLELVATGISYRAVPASTFAPLTPHGARIVRIAAAGPGPHVRSRHHRRARRLRGLASVAAALPFRVSAPPTAGGMSRTGVRGVRMGSDGAAAIVYGHGLGAVLVIEHRSRPAAPARRRDHGRRALSLRHVALGGGISAEELPTALGTLVRFERGGVGYTVVGSVPPATAEAVARGL
jgi:hypothetical protein